VRQWRLIFTFPAKNHWGAMIRTDRILNLLVAGSRSNKMRYATDANHEALKVAQPTTTTTTTLHIISSLVVIIPHLRGQESSLLERCKV
jgi:hypothetical protein